jgi:hypothetical protein
MDTLFRMVTCVSVRFSWRYDPRKEIRCRLFIDPSVGSHFVNPAQNPARVFVRSVVTRFLELSSSGFAR